MAVVAGGGGDGGVETADTVAEHGGSTRYRRLASASGADNGEMPLGSKDAAEGTACAGDMQGNGLARVVDSTRKLGAEAGMSLAGASPGLGWAGAAVPSKGSMATSAHCFGYRGEHRVVHGCVSGLSGAGEQRTVVQDHIHGGLAVGYWVDAAAALHPNDFGASNWWAESCCVEVGTVRPAACVGPKRSPICRDAMPRAETEETVDPAMVQGAECRLKFSAKQVACLCHC